MSKRKIIQLLKLVLLVELIICTALIADANCTISEIETYLEETQEEHTEKAIPLDIPIVEIPQPQPTEIIETPPQEVKTYPDLDIPLDDEYKTFAFEQCGYDEDFYCFIMSVIYCESDFDPYNVSDDGHDYGFMQIRDTYHDYYAEKFNVSDPKKPYDNLTVGIGLLKEYIEKHGHKNLALMCYNNGPGSAREKWNDGIYSTKYTVKVLAKYQEYLEQAGL